MSSNESFPTTTLSSQKAGQKGGRGRVGPKNEKLPVQRAIYLGTHSMPGRSVLGFVQGSRVVAGVTFMKKFPEVLHCVEISCAMAFVFNVNHPLT